jgi:hypothetical protein
MIQPSRTPKFITPKFGFNDFAERFNGRAAMIAFVVAIIFEAVTGKGIFSWLGLA